MAKLQMTSWSVLLVIALILLLLAANFWLKVDSQDLGGGEPVVTETTSAIQTGNPVAADLNTRLDQIAALGPRPEDTLPALQTTDDGAADAPLVANSR